MGNAGVNGVFRGTGTASERKQHFAGSAITPLGAMVRMYGPWVGQYCSEWSSKSLDASGHPQWPIEGSFNVKCVEGLVNQLAGRVTGSSKAGNEQLRAALLWQLVSHEKKLDVAEKELCHLRNKVQSKKKECEHLVLTCPMLERPPYGAANNIGEDDRGGRDRSLPVPLTPAVVPNAPPLPPLVKAEGAPGNAAHGAVPVGLADNKIAVPVALPPTEAWGVNSELGGNTSAQGIHVAGGKEEIRAQISAPLGLGDSRVQPIPSELISFPDFRQESPLESAGAIPKALALRRLEPFNSRGLKEEEEQPTERLRSTVRRVQEKEKLSKAEGGSEVEGINPMREVYKAPADVSTEVHYPWGV